MLFRSPRVNAQSILDEVRAKSGAGINSSPSADSNTPNTNSLELEERIRKNQELRKMSRTLRDE